MHICIESGSGESLLINHFSIHVEAYLYVLVFVNQGKFDVQFYGRIIRIYRHPEIVRSSVALV